MEFGTGAKTRTLWQIRTGTAFFILAVLFCLLSRYNAYMYIPTAVSVMLGGASVFWYLPAFFKKYKIFVGKNAVVVTRGVFINTSHIMPFKRLVFAGGFSTPLARVMRLKGITLRAARTAVLIPEIDAAEADRLIFSIGGEV